MYGTNYRIIQELMMRPWNHIHNLGFGLMMAHFYRHVKFYRLEHDHYIRMSRYPIIHKLHDTKKYGGYILCVGYTIFVMIIALPIIFQSNN